MQKPSNTPNILQTPNTSTVLEKGYSHTDNIIYNGLFPNEAKELIERYGGKAASLVWQMQHGNQKYLTGFSILEVASDTIPTYTKKGWKEFFRGSAKGDENGLVGVIESLKGAGLLDEIREIITDGSSRRVQDYAHYFDGNSHYKGVSSIIVSPYIDYHLGENWRHTFGSIIKHPDFEDTYLININEGRSQALVESNGNILKTIGFEDGISYISPFIPQILAMKQDTDRVGFIQNATSQTEFALLTGRLKELLQKTSGYDFMPETQGDVIFLQQRVFRKESLTKRDKKTLEYDYDNNQFGDQSVFNKGYPKIDYLKAKNFLKDYPESGKIILYVTEKNYFSLITHKESYGILRDPRVAGVIINPGQCQGLGSLEHETYRLLHHNIPVKVAYI